MKKTEVHSFTEHDPANCLIAGEFDQKAETAIPDERHAALT
jgi:hypothetical protein